MSRERNLALKDALDRYFSSFASTRTLVSDLVRERKHPIEVLILLCARLDALASDAAAEDTGRKKAFLDFVSAYGGNRDLIRSVSIGDLYYELAYHRWLLEGTISKPGRLHRFSRIDDPILHLLEDAGLPIMLKESEALLDTLMRLLKQEFRAVPKQPLSKPRIVKAAALEQMIVTGIRKTRLRKIVENLPRALKPLLESKKIGTILYERFRSESIHGATIIIDQRRFFTETGVYWKPLWSDYYGAFELIEFPAQFLLSLLERCIKTYRASLLAKGKIPPGVHFHAFLGDVFAALDLLDETLLPAGGRVRFKFDR